MHWQLEGFYLSDCNDYTLTLEDKELSLEPIVFGNHDDEYCETQPSQRKDYIVEHSLLVTMLKTISKCAILAFEVFAL